MDEISARNRQRWNALANARVEYSIPFLDFTPEQAYQYVGRHGILQDVRGKSVLCLASGGGQDSAAFGLLGANVTVFDLSDVQLERDRQAAGHHGYNLVARQGDMRDLSCFPTDAFDVVWQVYSINFVPAVAPVFGEVARVLKPGGVYFLQFANPFVVAVEDTWNGHAYPLRRPYLDGEDISQYFPDWDVAQPDGSLVKLAGPHEFRHTLSTVLNALVQRNFIFLGLWEWIRRDADPEPGSWPHFTQIAPPYLETFWRLQR
ncbi:MAG: methyltransferase domain-containing protein [Chloroflexota bacterium]